MSGDWHQAAIEAAELLDDLEREHGDDVTVGTVAIVIEVEGVDSEGQAYTGIHYRCSDARRWVQSGLFDAAARAVLATNEEAS